MERKTWTFREGEITTRDKIAIRGLCEAHAPAAKIFLTGEVGVIYFSDLALRALLAVNDTLEEPLFVLTAHRSVRMTRFEAKIVWAQVPFKMLAALLEQAVDGYDVKPFSPTVFDLYESLFTRMGFMNTCILKRDGFHHIWTWDYMNALTLFQKPMHMDVPIGEFFLLHMHDWAALGGRNTVPKATLAERDRVWDKNAARLTNAELDFLANL